MTGRELYRAQVTVVLVSLAAILACSVHGFYFAESAIYNCIDVVIVVLATLGIVYADNLAVPLCEFFTKSQRPERAPPST